MKYETRSSSIIVAYQRQRLNQNLNLAKGAIQEPFHSQPGSTRFISPNRIFDSVFPPIPVHPTNEEENVRILPFVLARGPRRSRMESRGSGGKKRENGGSRGFSAVG